MRQALIGPQFRRKLVISWLKKLCGLCTTHLFGACWWSWENLTRICSTKPNLRSALHRIIIIRLWSSESRRATWKDLQNMGYLWSIDLAFMDREGMDTTFDLRHSSKNVLTSFLLMSTMLYRNFVVQEEEEPSQRKYVFNVVLLCTSTVSFQYLLNNTKGKAHVCWKIGNVHLTRSFSHWWEVWLCTLRGRLEWCGDASSVQDLSYSWSAAFCLHSCLRKWFDGKLSETDAASSADGYGVEEKPCAEVLETSRLGIGHLERSDA